MHADAGVVVGEVEAAVALDHPRHERVVVVPTAATSQAKNSARPPASSIARTVSSPPSRARSRSATTTAAPSRAKLMAQARPMPLAAPVTSPALPSIEPAIFV